MKNNYKKFFSKTPTDSLPYDRLIVLEKPTCPISESYRRVKVGLEYSEVDKEIKTIQICSSVQGEGKSTTLLNLAATYCENGKKVLVIDLDFRRPALHKCFKIENKEGIVDVLAGKVQLEDAIKSKEGYPFDLLNRGSRPPYPTSILSSNEFEHLINSLKEKYDHILIDCPPILAVSDAVIISRLSDGIIFVVSEQETDKQAAKSAIRELQINKINILGCVVTNITSKQNGYGDRYSYYYRNYCQDK